MDDDTFIGTMWQRACNALDRAERLHGRFFEPGASGRAFAWQPPVDLFESETGVLVRAAIPDAKLDELEVRIDASYLRLSGRRAFPARQGQSVIRRLEIPYGRIARVIALPEGRYELASSQYKNGCLEIQLRRVGP